MDIALFRQNFPEFADTSRYPVNIIEFWANVCETVTSEDRWGSLYPLAINLQVAHELALSAANREASEQCQIPGAKNVMGGVGSKSVGSVSVSYTDSMGLAQERDAGHWSLTTYGTQYIRLARMIGQGCVQL